MFRKILKAHLKSLIVCYRIKLNEQRGQQKHKLISDQFSIIQSSFFLGTFDFLINQKMIQKY